MILNPIIPIWVATITCVLMIIIIVKNKSGMVKKLLTIFLLFVINMRIMIPNRRR